MVDNQILMITIITMEEKKMFFYFSTPSSLPTLIKAAIHLSRCSFSCPAEICTRIRAWSFGTTG